MLETFKIGDKVLLYGDEEAVVISTSQNGKVKLTSPEAWKNYKLYNMKSDVERYADWYDVEDVELMENRSIRKISENHIRKIVAESIKKVLNLEARERSMDIAARNAAFADITKDYNNSFPKSEPYSFSGDLSALNPREKAAFLQCKERILKIAKRKGIELPEDEVNRRAAINANISDYRRYQHEKMDAYQDRQDNRPDFDLLKNYNNDLGY